MDDMNIIEYEPEDVRVVSQATSTQIQHFTGTDARFISTCGRA
jgi:hypothetical protein